MDFQGLTLAQRQEKGWDKGSIIEDPQFVDPAHGDFRLKPGSPAAKIGFHLPSDNLRRRLYQDGILNVFRTRPAGEPFIFEHPHFTITISHSDIVCKIIKPLRGNSLDTND